MRLVIHAGIHRTGSSSLQDYLAANRGHLRDKGILYPGEDKNHQKLAWAVKRGEANAESILQLLECGDPAPEMILLSAEDFCIHTNLDWLAHVASRIPTEACIYLRRQDHWLMSWYNQHIKWPFDRNKSQMDADEFLGCINDFSWIDFDRLVTRWEKVLGTESVHVAVVESGQVEDVTRDFIGRLGLEMDEMPMPAKRINDSLPVHLLEPTRRLGLYDMSPYQRVRLLSALKSAHPRPADLAKTVYSPFQRSQILDMFYKSNARLAKRLFQRDFLFMEPPPDRSDPYYKAPELCTVDYIRHWFRPLLEELTKKTN